MMRHTIFAKGVKCVLPLLIGLVAMTSLPKAAHADVGTRLRAVGSYVDVRILESYAGFTSEIWLWHNNGWQWVGRSNETNKDVRLNTVPGQELVFTIRVQETQAVFYQGPSWRNADGVTHARADEAGSYYGFRVGFEDLWGGGDYDYDDIRVSVWPARPL